MLYTPDGNLSKNRSSLLKIKVRHEHWHLRRVRRTIEVRYGVCSALRGGVNPVLHDVGVKFPVPRFNQGHGAPVCSAPELRTRYWPYEVTEACSRSLGRGLLGSDMAVRTHTSECCPSKEYHRVYAKYRLCRVHLQGTEVTRASYEARKHTWYGHSLPRVTPSMTAHIERMADAPSPICASSSGWTGNPATTAFRVSPSRR